jgi:rhamnogalacturonyl hydrolase YesR
MTAGREKEHQGRRRPAGTAGTEAGRRQDAAVTGMTGESRLKISDSLRRLETWIEDHDYRGYEPFDGLSSIFRPLTFGNLFADRLLQQLVRQSPVNLRPLLGIKPQDSTKGRGYMAWGYLAMMKSTGNPAYGEKAIRCLDWLMENKSPKFAEYSWANHFDFASRAGRYTKHESIIVWSALIGYAFLDGYEMLADRRYLDVAESVCRWILDLPRERTESGTCISYLATGQSSIHNANMLGAAVLARTGRLTGKAEYLDVAAEAMKYSCSRQRADGSWWYAEDSIFHWVDNFHTGYNLDSLKCYIENTGDRSYCDGMLKGLEFYKRHFFEEDGCPRYYHNRTYPVDSQCNAQAIETLANFSSCDKDSLALAVKVALWTIVNMQDPEGYFYYRKYPLFKVKTPMLHWAQAVTYRALARLIHSLRCGE